MEVVPSGDGEPVPINEHVIISSREVETGVRDRLEKYQGEELVSQLVDYVMLNVIEVVLTKDPEPSRLERLEDGTVSLLTKLTPGLIQTHPKKS